MNPFHAILAASALAATATVAMGPLPAAPKSETAIVRSDEVSAAQRRYYHRRHAPVRSDLRYRGFADPSFGPDGKPYPVPENLRNQCYIDEGYGRFSACPFRN